MSFLAPRALLHLQAGLALVILSSSLCAGVAHAETVQGQLELQWGDPKPAAAHQVRPRSQFIANLVTDDGRRIALDAQQARRAAGDLYALGQGRVAVSFVGSSYKAQPVVDAIVPTRLTQRAHPVSKEAVAPLIAGNTRWVTIMCKFSDVTTEQKPVSFFAEQYGSSPGQLNHYWQEVSYGKINISGSTAYGWVNLPQPRSYYTVEGQRTQLQKLFADCAAAADPFVNFNGLTGINMMFNAELDGFAWGGGGCAPLEGVQTCTRVTWNPPWSFSNSAPLAHEMGHGYGLPHSDNSDGDTDPYDNPWDNMSDAWSNGVKSPTYGTLPKHINIFQRDRLGWIDSARKVVIAPHPPGVVQFQLDAASLMSSGNKQMIVLAASTAADPYANVVYTLEARKKTGNYEAALAGNAVIIHKVQNYGWAYSQDAAVPVATQSSNEGSMFKPGETWSTPEATHWVTIVSENATGFVVQVGPKPVTRVTGGNLPPRLGPSGVSPTTAGLPPRLDTTLTQPRVPRTPGVTRSVRNPQIRLQEP